MKKRRWFTCGVIFRHALERVPKIKIRVRKFSHWEIALEQATMDVKFLDAMLEVRLQIFR